MEQHLPVELQSKVLEQLSWHNLIRYSHAGARARAAVQHVVGGRLRRLLGAYFSPDSISVFWKIISGAKGGITGSAAYWVTESEPAWKPNDLNLLVADFDDDTDRMASFLSWQGYTLTDALVKVPLALLPSLVEQDATPWDARRRIFFRVGTNAHGRRVTLATAADANVMRMLLYGRHSLDTILVSSHLLVTPYPLDLIYSTAVERGAGMTPEADEERDRRRRVLEDRGILWVEAANSCRNTTVTCPATMRRVRGARGFGLFRWNATPLCAEMDFEAMERFKDGGYAYTWTWGICRNAACPFNRFPRDLVARQMQRVEGMNAKVMQIKHRSRIVEDCTPAFPKVYKGVLFATGCTGPMLVPVPLDYGLQDYRTIDDLRAYYWVRSEPEGCADQLLFESPARVAGCPTVANSLARRIPLEGGKTLVVFLKTADGFFTENTNRLLTVALGRQLRGDVLAVLFDKEGRPTDARYGDFRRYSTAITRWWNAHPLLMGSINTPSRLVPA